MIIDSSALLTILLQEPEAERMARAIALDATRLMSAATWLEISIAVFLRVGEEGLRSLDLLNWFQGENYRTQPGVHVDSTLELV
jgi:ribonuclease VapC